MTRNLSAEMVRYGVSISDINRVIGKTERSTRDKINGKFAFTFPEAIKIRDTFFTGMSLEYLFATEDK